MLLDIATILDFTNNFSNLNRKCGLHLFPNYYYSTTTVHRQSILGVQTQPSGQEHGRRKPLVTVSGSDHHVQQHHMVIELLNLEKMVL
jgi:hypothetical protein